MIVLNSIFSSVASILHMRAMKMTPLSLTIPMLAFTPLFLLLTSSLMLGEFPSSVGLIGILSIVLATYLLEIRNRSEGYLATFKAVIREKGSLMMLFVAIIFSIKSTLAKVGIQHSNTLFFPVVRNGLISSLFLPVVLKKSKKVFKADISQPDSPIDHRSIQCSHAYLCLSRSLFFNLCLFILKAQITSKRSSS